MPILLIVDTRVNRRGSEDLPSTGTAANPRLYDPPPTPSRQVRSGGERTFGMIHYYACIQRP